MTDAYTIRRGLNLGKYLCDGLTAGTITRDQVKAFAEKHEISMERLLGEGLWDAMYAPNGEIVDLVEHRWFVQLDCDDGPLDGPIASPFPE